MAPKPKDTTPETKYPAKNEDVDTIITGSDGKDYVVELVDKIKKWIPYLPEPTDIVIIEKVLPPTPVPESKSRQTLMKAISEQLSWPEFCSESTTRLRKEEPQLSGAERKAIISDLWKEYKKK
jgi:hypothetical protein